MTGAACWQIDSLSAWLDILTLESLQFLAPCVASCALILTAMRKARSPLVLPGVLAAIPLAFHAVLLAGGWSLTDAQNAGWVAKAAVGLRACPLTNGAMRMHRALCIIVHVGACVQHPLQRCMTGLDTYKLIALPAHSSCTVAALV